MRSLEVNILVKIWKCHQGRSFLHTYLYDTNEHYKLYFFCPRKYLEVKKVKKCKVMWGLWRSKLSFWSKFENVTRDIIFYIHTHMIQMRIENSHKTPIFHYSYLYNTPKHQSLCHLELICLIYKKPYIME